MLANVLGSVLGQTKQAVSNEAFKADIAQQAALSRDIQGFMTETKNEMDHFEAVLNMQSAAAAKSKKITEEFKQ